MGFPSGSITLTEAFGPGQNQFNWTAIGSNTTAVTAGEIRQLMQSPLHSERAAQNAKCAIGSGVSVAAAGHVSMPSERALRDR